MNPKLTERFSRDLDPLIAADARIGLAVSGGPDSVALLLLAAEAGPDRVEAATVDHALRGDSAAEARAVADLCAPLGIRHAILTVSWDERPASAIQEQARFMRYRLLGEWARGRGLAALVTGHHLDDQAETFVMRLGRGAGVRGLAAMRPVSRSAVAGLPIVRPLLGWRHSELLDVCAAAGVEPARDPSNQDQRFERVRIRAAIAEADWLDPSAIAQSASHLADADAALDWAAGIEWDRAVTEQDGETVYSAGDAPREIRRRIIRRAVLALGTEGGGAELRGRELDELLDALSAGRRSTLRGVLCVGGSEWRFSPAPPRKDKQRLADIRSVEG